MIVAIIQARMGSTRLSNKTMALIQNLPLLEHVSLRVRASQYVQKVVIATTAEASDAVIVEWARLKCLPTTTGSEKDVLDRFYNAALEASASVIIRITADDPFKDPEVIDRIVATFLSQAPQLDYASNTIKPTYPEGLDVEVFSFEALARAWREATLPSEREHVTPYIWKNPELFKVKNIEYEKDLSALRWTIDYDNDLAFAREVYARLYPSKPIFFMHDILTLLEHEPWIGEINTAQAQRNEGYYRSLAQEEKR